MAEDKLKKMYFTGIAGAGMSALSQIAVMEGHEVSGSDRDFDNNRSSSLKQKLEKLSIKIFPQNGSGISKETDILIVSTAVESANPDILKAKDLNIPIIHRSAFLSDYVDRFKTIAVAGTSGKSTVAAMIYEILEKAGKSPSIITGAALESIKKKGFVGNAFRGQSDILIVEADESDGTIVNYHPYAGIILNISKDHPARDTQDTFFIKDHSDWVMRTHTSPMQIRAMQKYGAPLRAVISGRVFRNEATDASHDHTFYQMEGLVIDKNISIDNLVAVMKELLQGVLKREVEIRLRPGHFPFVEPGFELDMKCLVCEGKGCGACKHTGWVETLPCGLIHPKVIRSAGLDPDEYQGFAFGLGSMRLVMQKYGIEDIRYLHEGKMEFLEQF